MACIHIISMMRQPTTRIRKPSTIATPWNVQPRCNGKNGVCNGSECTAQEETPTEIKALLLSTEFICDTRDAVYGGIVSHLGSIKSQKYRTTRCCMRRRFRRVHLDRVEGTRIGGISAGELHANRNSPWARLATLDVDAYVGASHRRTRWWLAP